MTKTFFFYDLETTGLSPREDRIMQFAGQRTDMQLNPIGEPINELIRLNDDTVPSPEALLITGITPQQTVENGYSEVDFCKKLINEWFTPDTIVVGFNNVRFDDEFIRHLLWRNFYDPYEWAWKDGRSRWDMLDVVRMTRALRPEGITWPVNENGEQVNKLELITKANGISHENAHDALSDVLATIDVAGLIKQYQPRLFDYLLNLRDKKEVQKLVNLDDKKPFVYSSGRYDKQFAKTTVAFPLTTAPKGNVVVYDLRHDPSQFVKLGSEDIVKRLFASWEERQAESFESVPVKILQFNKCPAVAELSVLAKADGWEKISLNQEVVEKHMKVLLENPEFAENVRSVYESRPDFERSPDPEAKLYDSLVPDIDKIRIEAVRNADENKLADFHPEFRDERLLELLLHYKARNFPKSLSESEGQEWETWRTKRLEARIPVAVESINRLYGQPDLAESQKFILSELSLWIESIMPADSY